VDADHFITPDLRGRTLIGYGELETYNFPFGDAAGEVYVTLTEDEMPTHSHTDLGHTHTYSPPGISAPVVAPGEVPVQAVNLIPGITGVGNANLTNAGGGEAHVNMQPYYAVKYCVQAR